MKLLDNKQGYISPQMEVIDIMPMSVLCQSEEFKATLEGMQENEYTFTF